MFPSPPRTARLFSLISLASFAAPGCCGGKEELRIETSGAGGTESLELAHVVAGSRLTLVGQKPTFCVRTNVPSTARGCWETTPGVAFASETPTIARFEGEVLVAVAPGLARVTAAKGGFKDGHASVEVVEPTSLKLLVSRANSAVEPPQPLDGVAVVASTVHPIDSAFLDGTHALSGQIPFEPVARGVSFRPIRERLLVGSPLLLVADATPGPASVTFEHRKVRHTASLRVIRVQDITSLRAKVIFENKRPRYIQLHPMAGSSPVLGAPIRYKDLNHGWAGLSALTPLQAAGVDDPLRVPDGPERSTLLEVVWNPPPAKASGAPKARVWVEGSPAPPLEVSLADEP